MNYFKQIELLGFLPKFINIYFCRMLNLGFTQEKAFLFFDKIYKENESKKEITNVFDVIEKAKINNI